MRDDYYGPLWDADPESRMGYLSIDNTRLSSYTETAQTERGGTHREPGLRGERRSARRGGAVVTPEEWFDRGERLLEGWRIASIPAGGLSANEESAFEYAWHLAWRSMNGDFD